MLNFSVQHTKIAPKIQTFKATEPKSTNEKMDQLAKLLQDPEVLRNAYGLKDQLVKNKSKAQLEAMLMDLRDFWTGLFYLVRADLDGQNNEASHSLSKGSL